MWKKKVDALPVSGGVAKDMSSTLADQYRPRIWAQMWGDGIEGGGGGVAANENSCALHMEPK